MKTHAYAHEPEPEPRQKSESASRLDLLLVGGGAVLFWVLSVALELNEQVLAWTRPWEKYQLDELPGVLLFLALALAWYAWRRVREAQVQLRRRVEAEARLADTLVENRQLSLSHVRLQEEERRQLARELHDELGQHLNAIKIDAVSIRNWSEGGVGEVHGAACAIVQVTDHVQCIVREMLQRLRPVGLDELGLPAALEHLALNWRARNPATRLELTINAVADDLGEHENITLYRIVQEGLTNVVKHAQAACVRIALEGGVRGIVLTISDDGAGASQWDATVGFGLVGMRERVEALGGSLEIASRAGQGFFITASLPVAETRA